jgi:hypothetical protein
MVGSQILHSRRQIAERFIENSIDGLNEKHSLSSEIEPGSVKTLRFSLKSAQWLNG